MAEPISEYMAAARSPPAIRSGEEEVLPSKGSRTQRAFGGAVVDLEHAIVDVARERAPP